jgi:hypothetical protein
MMNDECGIKALTHLSAFIPRSAFTSLLLDGRARTVKLARWLKAERSNGMRLTEMVNCAG